MVTLKLTIEENQKNLINKIYSKRETMFKEFQTYFMRTTTELVQILQSNKYYPNNNVARLF